MSELLLNITTVTAPPAVIAIDGARYPLLSAEALPLASIQRLQRDAPRLGHLLQIDEKTPDEATETGQLLRAVCALVLDAPADVHARLTDVHRVAIVHSFTQLQSTSATAPMRTRARSIGAKSSRGSNGSMAARRKRG
jgi:hypothetical protein